MQVRLTSWSQSLIGLWLAAILFPPLGLFLLWKRPSPGVSLKLLGSLCMGFLAVVHLVVFFGLRVEMDGSATRPIFVFGTQEAHYEALDKDRAQQQSVALAPAEAAGGPIDLRIDAEGLRELGAYWTDFRGPGRDGHYQEMQILTQWPPGGLEECWRQPIGGGYASFVIANGKAYTIEQRRSEEVVAAYEMRTGRELWNHSWKAHFQELMGGSGPRATPTWHEGKLYALGAEGELCCLDAETGEVRWAKNILRDNEAVNLNWAMAASPLVVDNKVIVLPGGRFGTSVAAYDKLTGEPVWKALSDKQAYTSPMLVTLAGRRQLLIVSAERALGLTVEEGNLLWEYPWKTSNDVNAAQPLVVDGNRFYISAGYGHGAALVKISAEEDRFTAHTVWETHRMKNKFSGAVLYEGHIYGLDEAILACIEVETGELRWKGGRYGYGQLLLASGHLVIVTEKGDLVLVKATPEGHQELARFSAIAGKTWNNPAIAGGCLLVRNAREMACYRITP